MEEQLVSFETAKLAKEEGFNWLCYSWFFISKIDNFDNVPKYYRDKAIADYIEIDNKLVSHLIGGQHCKTINSKFKNSEDQPNILACPTQSLLQKWLREKHKIHIQIQVLGQFVNGDNKFYSQVILFGDNKWISKFISNKLTYTYEEALEAGLQEALKLIK